MKGERVLAELIGLVGIIVYGVMLQHLYAEMMHEPDRSWLNRGITWWTTRGSRAMEKKLQLVWNRQESATEPTPGE